jgi:hypothetical protein
VATRAAAIAGTPILLEATVDRRLLLRAARLVHRFPGVPAEFHPAQRAAAYTPPEQLTHRIDVSGVIWCKRAAMAAHVSQATMDGGTRTLRVFSRLPRPLFRRIFRYEWFVQRDDRGERRSGDLTGSIFAGLPPG